MERGRGKLDSAQAEDTCLDCAVGVRQVGTPRFVATIGLMLACLTGLAGAPMAEACPNEAARTGPSANLPDCRAYEQVTPTDKSSIHQDLGEASIKDALASTDGNRIALKAFATLGPDPEGAGSFSVFSRTASGWALMPVRPANAPGSSFYSGGIFNPDLTQIGVKSETVSPLSPEEPFQVGAPGGPYERLAAPPDEQHILRKEGKSHQPMATTVLMGATSDFSHIVVASIDHTLLSATPTGTDENAYDLYEWVNGQGRLVNVDNKGSLIGKCGATLGFGQLSSGGFPEFRPQLAHNAISENGSKVFFTSPDPYGPGGGEGCTHYTNTLGRTANPTRLYMRVNQNVGTQEEGDTVEVSAPNEGVHLSTAEEQEMPVVYEGAAADGSSVFFITERALTPDATPDYFHLYEYDTEAPEGGRLTLAFQEKKPNIGAETEEVFVSDDGSVVYFYRDGYTRLYRYERANEGYVHEIASVALPTSEESGGKDEAPYSTPNGEFFLFSSGGVGGESRGAGRNEIYRYDHADGSVMCVSCGPGDPPADAEAFMGNAGEGSTAVGDFQTPNETPERTIMSDDGNRVFFESTGSLVPGAVNEGVLNVYEWEADGVEACTQSLGCAYLISQGSSAVDSLLIGASSNGSDVFFLTHAQLVPQDTDNVGDIYDARIGGGFPVPAESSACLGDTCQSVPLALSDLTPASSSFAGPGSPAVALTTVKSKVKTKVKGCGRGRVRKKDRCIRSMAHKGAVRDVKHNPGGSK